MASSSLPPAAAASPDCVSFSGHSPLPFLSPASKKPTLHPQPLTTSASDLQVAIDKNIRLTEDLNDERESRQALLQLMESSAASPDTRRMAQLERRCGQLQQQLRASSGLVKSLSEEVATLSSDCAAKRKRIALLETLLSDHQAVVSNRYAASEAPTPTAASAPAPRPLATVRGGADPGSSAVSTAFVSWLKGMGGAAAHFGQ
jgi:hypothetical protein